MFHGILLKEHSGTFYELPWGLYEEMSTNTLGQSGISTHKTEIKYISANILFSTAFQMIIGKMVNFQKVNLSKISTFYVRNLRVLVIS